MNNQNNNDNNWSRFVVGLVGGIVFMYTVIQIIYSAKLLYKL